ncbi:MAG: 2-succinyl-5-enolpyruvyl-6-hydroxy-3-cyclohexene-1-carboxylic-acid synthase [Opitutae bacterium]|nr:2-succinyl-5-enolpyruvyl-6-hydroxy-3-cyclohexene-1-carboxylic-acid synthase [Opitutae bacterium]
MNQDEELIAQANQSWGEIVARTLYELGVFNIFFSPGSRSTPLVLGFERHPELTCTPVLDERSAGYIALGFSKRTQRPSAILCTSGSALTNWFPAVVEASYSGTPIILLSADRPPELQDCGAGQTINQVNLFGTFVRSFYQISLPELSAKSINKLRASIADSYSYCIGQNPGPVHLNFPFREPFHSKKKTKSLPIPPLRQRKPLSLSKRDRIKNIDSICIEVSDAKCPIVIAGEHAPGQEVINWLSNYEIPVLCDSLSPLRNTAFPNRILRYENLLRHSRFVRNTVPDLVVALGPLPTSKTLRKWINDSNCKRIVIEPRGINVDPLSSPSLSVNLPYEDLTKLVFRKADGDWLQKWTHPEQLIESNFTSAFAKELPNFEGKIARILSLHLPDKSLLHVANSMPIRDIEWFWQAGNKEIKLFGNRGVNGIDGTLGTAIGIAHHSNIATFLLTGELGFLHDSNALLFASQFEGSLNVLLVNNDGGGIFENLPIAEQPEFEKCFATPQCINFINICQAHNIDYKQPKNWRDVIKLIEKPIKKGIRVVEIKTDRKSDFKTRKKLLAIGPRSRHA